MAIPPRRMGGGVQSITRALSILEALAESATGLTLTGVSRAVDLPPSTAHRLLTTLQRQRFVRFDPVAMVWQVGVQAFVVGNAFARTRDIGATARPYMRRMMEDSGETANLFALSDGGVLCMAQVESRHVTCAVTRPGGRVRMHCTGAGKAMLATLRDDAVEGVVALCGLAPSTRKTIVTARTLKADLGRIRARGFAVDDEECAMGLRCVAAPILDELGMPIAALSLSGPTSRVGVERVEALGTLVMNAARAATLELGGRPAPDRATP
jgi:IclR family transcriptional regulator, acetate operon repressor